MLLQIMQGIKLCEHGWKLFEFNEVYTRHRVIGTFDTYSNAIKSSTNVVSPEYTTSKKQINGYNCLVLQKEDKYIGAIYIENKLIYLDPNPLTIFSFIREKWKTRKDIIQQLMQFIKLLEPINTCCIS